MGHAKGRTRKIGHCVGFRIFVMFIITMVTSAIVTGLILSGSPEKERSRQFDAARVSDLQQITFALDAYFNYQNRLPSTLEELLARRDYPISSILDPRSRNPYEFTVIDVDTYKLCATFEAQSNTGVDTKYAPARPKAYPGFTTEDFWFHGSGHLCYTIDVRKDPVHFPAKL